MNWYESRSNNYYDEDSEGGSSPPMKWYEFLLAIPFVFIFIIYFETMPILFGFYYVVKKTYEDGELEFPHLTIIGFCLGAILIVAQTSQLVDLSNHPFITFCSVIYVLFFTLAPLTGLGLRFLQLLSLALNNLKPITYITLLGMLIVVLLALIKFISQP